MNDKPNLDITEISYEISGGKITIALKVVGIIEDDDNLAYWLQFISEEARYHFSYTNGEGVGTGESYVTDDVSLENVTASDDTISCTFDWYGDDDYPTGQLEFDGQAMIDIWEGNDVVAFYSDTVFISEGMDEDEEDEEDEESDDGDGGGTPGFETIVLLVALGIALIVLRRRKIN